jgi:hypothetical protein
VQRLCSPGHRLITGRSSAAVITLMPVEMLEAARTIAKRHRLLV